MQTDEILDAVAETISPKDFKTETENQSVSQEAIKKNLTETSDKLLQNTNHLQYIEDNPDEIYQFGDTLVEEVTRHFIEESTQRSTITDTLEGTDITLDTFETEVTDEILSPTTVAPSMETISTMNEFETEISVTEIPTTAVFTDNSVSKQTDSLTQDQTVINTEATENTDGISSTTPSDNISDSIRSSPGTTTRGSYTFTSKPLRYSIYNRRPGNRLQEIMARRTAMMSTTTTEIVPEENTILVSAESTSTEFDAVESTTDASSDTPELKETKLENDKMIDVKEDILPTEYDPYSNSMVKINASDILIIETPIIASNILTVSTNPIEYFDAVTESVVDNVASEIMIPLNIADEYEKQNYFDQDKEDAKIISTDSDTNITDDSILGTIKGIMISSVESFSVTSTPRTNDNENITVVGNEVNDYTVDNNNTDAGEYYYYDYPENVTDILEQYYDYTEENNVTAAYDLLYTDDYLYPEENSTSVYDKYNADYGGTIPTTETDYIEEFLDDTVSIPVDESSVPQGVAILVDGFYYPEKTDAIGGHSTEVQSKYDQIDPVREHSSFKLSNTNTAAGRPLPQEEFKISSGFLVKDPPKRSEIIYGPTDVQGNQVRTDRKNTLDPEDDSQLQEMIIETEDPNSPPVKLIVHQNSDRLSVGDRDTFDISVSSSLFTGNSEPMRQMTSGQVFSTDLDRENTIEVNEYEESEPIQIGSDISIDNVGDEDGNNDEKLGMGIGQIIPVDLNEEEAEPAGNSEAEIPEPPPLPPTEAPSFFGALFDIFSRPERPRPRPRPQRPIRPDRYRPSISNREELNTDNIDISPSLEHSRPIRPPFRIQRPDHPYRPFRPTGFRPPPPSFRPPLEPVRPTLNENENITTNEEGVDHPELELGNGSEKPFSGRPLFPERPETGFPPMQFRPLGSLIPPPLIPLPAILLPLDTLETDFDSEVATVSYEEDPISVDQSSVSAIDDVVDFITPLEILSTEEITETNSQTTTEKPLSFSPVIEINGPLQNFINQLQDSPKISTDDMPIESKISQTTELPTRNTIQNNPSAAFSVIDKHAESLEYINENVENYADTKIMSEETTELSDHSKSEKDPEELFTEGLLDIVHHGDQDEHVEQSILTTDYSNDANIRDTLDILVPAQEDGEQMLNYGNKPIPTISELEQVTTTLIPLPADIENIQSDPTKIVPLSTEKTTYTETTYISTEPTTMKTTTEHELLSVDFITRDEPEKIEELNEIYEPIEAVSTDIFDGPVISVSHNENIIGRHPLISTAILATSTETLNSRVPQVSTSISNEFNSNDNLKERKTTTPHPYHNIPDGSFVSSSHIQSDLSPTEMRNPRPRPTVVLPGSRPTRPYHRPPIFDQPPPRRRPSTSSEYMPSSFSADLTPPRPIEAPRPESSHEKVVKEQIFESENEHSLPPSLPNLQ